MDLLQLQNLCKRDSESYREDFQLQYRHYQTQLQLFKLKPNKESHEFEALINFLSHVRPAALTEQLRPLIAKFNIKFILNRDFAKSFDVGRACVQEGARRLPPADHRFAG